MHGPLRMMTTILSDSSSNQQSGTHVPNRLVACFSFWPWTQENKLVQTLWWNHWTKSGLQSQTLPHIADPAFLICKLHSVILCNVCWTVLSAWTCCCVQLSHCLDYNFITCSNALYNQHICDMGLQQDTNLPLEACDGLLLYTLANSRRLRCMLTSVFTEEQHLYWHVSWRTRLVFEC